jgi:hypothetical protein
MKSSWIASIAIIGVACAGGGAEASPVARTPGADAGVSIVLSGNTSSNSSSNTSSNSSARGSSYVLTHEWSVTSDRDGHRRAVRGSTRAERFAPAPERQRRPRPVYIHSFDDDD